MTVQELKHEVGCICLYVAGLPQQKRLSSFRAEVAKFRDLNDREFVSQLVAAVVEMSDDPNLMKTWEKIVMFSAGFALVATILVLACLYPSPTTFQILIFRVCIGLGAAGFGCVLPGIFHLEGKAAGWTIRATGAVAFFILIYLVNPPAVVEANLNASKQAPLPDGVPAASSPHQ